jgi:hypothetical protein
MPKQGTHFWLMTFADERGHYGANGTMTPEPGATRIDMYNVIHATLVERDPDLRGVPVIAFDIQPNRL